MIDNSMGRRLSRRHFIQASAIAVVAGGITGCASSGGGLKAAPGLVGYQPTPKGNQRCDNCKLWEPPASCQSVSGAISPQGWCNIYAKA